MTKTRPIHTIAWFATMMMGMFQGVILEEYTRGIFWLLACITIILVGNMERS